MKMDIDEKIAIGALVSLVLLYSLLLAMATWESVSQWKKFEQEHACRVVSKVSGDVIVLPIIGTPGKTGYICNDGITYYR